MLYAFATKNQNKKNKNQKKRRKTSFFYCFKKRTHEKTQVIFIKLKYFLVYQRLQKLERSPPTMTDKKTAASIDVVSSLVANYKTKYPLIMTWNRDDYGSDILFKNRKPDWRPIWRLKKFDETSLETIKTMILDRSTVTDYFNNHLSVGTPWTIPHNLFIKMFKKEFATTRDQDQESRIDDHMATRTLIDKFKFEELVEGTDINVYYYDNRWQFASKCINKDGPYMRDGPSDKETVELFECTAKEVGFNIEELDKSLSYNFVFQHPSVVYVHKFVSPEIYLESVYKIDREGKKAIQLMDMKLPTGVKRPEYVFANCYLGLKGIFNEWKGTLSRKIWEDDPFEGKYLMHDHTYRGISITHMASGLRTNTTNCHFKGLYREINGCQCDVRVHCSCKMKRVMPRAMSGNIVNATRCKVLCSDCKVGKRSKYICTTCSDRCTKKVKIEAEAAAAAERKRIADLIENEDDDDDERYYRYDEHEDEEEHEVDDGLEYGSSCRCMTCHNEACA